MEVINGSSLSNMCDYSFGDHLGSIDPVNLIGGFMKEANSENQEFLDKCKEFEGRVMTLFIDNIRLYSRPLWVNEGPDAQWVTHLLSRNDLLGLCASLPNNKFVIFTSHEDTPIDTHIKIPDNVLGIHATNAEYFGGKVHPFPYGLQRKIGSHDHRHEILKEEIDKDVKPTKMLYINCGLGKERNDKERAYLPHFEGLEWATCRFDKDSKFFPYEKYKDFLDEMRDHKFQVCPLGHGMDCHRNWELLYMRRVPVMKEHPYFRELMKGFPVLFVKDWPDITRKLLEDSDHLYQEAQLINMKRLDLNLIYSTIVNSYL